MPSRPSSASKDFAHDGPAYHEVLPHFTQGGLRVLEPDQLGYSPIWCLAFSWPAPQIIRSVGLQSGLGLALAGAGEYPVVPAARRVERLASRRQRPDRRGQSR